MAKIEKKFKLILITIKGKLAMIGGNHNRMAESMPFGYASQLSEFCETAILGDCKKIGDYILVRCG